MGRRKKSEERQPRWAFRRVGDETIEMDKGCPGRPVRLPGRKAVRRAVQHRRTDTAGAQAAGAGAGRLLVRLMIAVVRSAGRLMLATVVSRQAGSGGRRNRVTGLHHAGSHRLRREGEHQQPDEGDTPGCAHGHSREGRRGQRGDYAAIPPVVHATAFSPAGSRGAGGWRHAPARPARPGRRPGRNRLRRPRGCRHTGRCRRSSSDRPPGTACAAAASP